MYTQAHKSRRDRIYRYNISSRTGIMLASRRDMCYDYTVTLHLDELCTTTMISTTHTATITRRIAKSTRRISMRIMRVMGMITNRLHTGTMHDII